MLSPASYKPKAAGMILGDRRRVDHDCGPGRTLTIRCDERGINAYCFRCNDWGYVASDPVPLAVRLERIAKSQAADNKVVASVDLPAPRVTAWAAWPPACRLWLLKAGLSSHDLPKLGAYYHPPTDRVVLAVSDPLLGTLYWQARAVDGRQPKYLGAPVDKAAVLPKYGSANDVTLTEDILSAYKVGLVGEGWSLMGTSISKLCLSELMARGCKVNVWLDSDPPGRRAAKKVLAALRGAGIQARDILTERDPKLIHREQIKELLA